MEWGRWISTSLRVEWLHNLNIRGRDDSISGYPLGVPIYERLDGPGLETDWLMTVGAQYAF